MFNMLTNWTDTLQVVDGAPYGGRQVDIYAARDRESEVTIMQEMQCRKIKVGTHTL